MNLTGFCTNYCAFISCVAEISNAGETKSADWVQMSQSTTDQRVLQNFDGNCEQVSRPLTLL